MLCIRESGRGGALRVWADGEKVVFSKTGIHMSCLRGCYGIKCEQMFGFLKKVGRKGWTNGKVVR